VDQRLFTAHAQNWAQFSKPPRWCFGPNRTGHRAAISRVALFDVPNAITAEYESTPHSVRSEAAEKSRATFTLCCPRVNLKSALRADSSRWLHDAGTSQRQARTFGSTRYEPRVSVADLPQQSRATR
jgi:hypothetical protein